MKEYIYNTKVWINKLFLAFSLMIVGTLIFYYIPINGEFAELLISLIYISGFVLLIFDALPVLYRSIKVKGKRIVITYDKLILHNYNQKLEIDRKDIGQVKFKSQSVKDYIISSDESMEEIDSKINKMLGRRLVITHNNSKTVIYLELLDKDFLLDFINWYQDKSR